MMRSFSPTTGLLLLLLLLAHLTHSGVAGYTLYTTANCEDLVAAAEALSTGNVEIYLGIDVAREGIGCEEWTDLNITQNKLKITAYGGTNIFTNIRFVVSDGAVLRSETHVHLTGDADPQTVNGGVLHVADGGKARFLMSAFMSTVGVLTTAEETVHGGCIYNEGYIRFEGSFGATLCNTLKEGDATPGNGSGIWNGAGGKIIFKEFAEITYCGQLDEGLGRASLGGAIFSMGKMTFFGQVGSFVRNDAKAGGAIYNEGELKFLRESTIHFRDNQADEDGAGVYNEGTLVMRSREAWFASNYAGGDGGAIFNQEGGMMTFVKPVAFDENRADGNGGAFYLSYDAVDDLPTRATYTGNYGPNPEFNFFCDDVYVKGEMEGDYYCLP